jgi:ribonuclease J
MMFPDAELMGVDIVTPDFTYLEENSKHVRGLVLTHGHEDHIGGIPFLLALMKIPVYGTAFTLALVERRLDEHEMLKEVNLNRVKAGETLVLGPFSIEFIHVTHSTVSCVALAITTPLGVIMHTGDFKVDPSPTDNELFDLHKFAEYGKRGVLLLMSDSTNVDRSGYTESERAVAPRLAEMFMRAPRRIVISCFSSSIHRLQQILDAADEYGRKVAFIGRSMNTATEIAHNLGFLTIPNGILLRPQDLMQTAPSKVCAIVSGTQGRAECPHYSGERKSDLPHDESHRAARSGPGVRSDESSDPRFGAWQRGGTAADPEPGSSEIFRAGSRRVPADDEACATGAASDALQPGGDVRSRVR